MMCETVLLPTVTKCDLTKSASSVKKMYKTAPTARLQQTRSGPLSLPPLRRDGVPECWTTSSEEVEKKKKCEQKADNKITRAYPCLCECVVRVDESVLCRSLVLIFCFCRLYTCYVPCAPSCPERKRWRKCYQLKQAKRNKRYRTCQHIFLTIGGIVKFEPYHFRRRP